MKRGSNIGKEESSFVFDGLLCMVRLGSGAQFGMHLSFVSKRDVRILSIYLDEDSR